MEKVFILQPFAKNWRVIDRKIYQKLYYGKDFTENAGNYCVLLKIALCNRFRKPGFNRSSSLGFLFHCSFFFCFNFWAAISIQLHVGER
jgi:hypothetical protein